MAANTTTTAAASISTTAPKTIYLKDYRPPHFLVDTVDLFFDIYDDKTIVQSLVKYYRNPSYAKSDTANTDTNLAFVLPGVNLKLLSIRLDSNELSSSAYTVTAEDLKIHQVPDTFTLEIKTEIHPETNTELMGLFKSGGNFCTQCEPEGFRRMTYYPDRPDVMAKFTTLIHADKEKYPVLLSNGNKIGQGVVDEKRHWVKWEDPFKKPCYLFALVAGNLVGLYDSFLTMKGRLVSLRLFVEEENQDKCHHAMQALKKSMKWDEETYGREYDLDIYMIVAVNDFNMGAMENKGLNIFNSKYILARPETATDTDYLLIDAVVGHEYFHNWSGNRITCRDWFQLSLKEGLTVFRDHHFSSDISQSPVSLITSTQYLRNYQFSEDSGPMAHPIRPESYIEINNFYTTTIYEKGSEVIRMLRTILGRETFRKAMDLYFERFDGQAVTTDDFVSIMEEAGKIDLTQFRLWYRQAGTPEITVTESYDENQKQYDLTLTQSCPATPSQPNKLFMMIPVNVGLLNKEGDDLLPNKTESLILREKTQTFSFKAINERPILSILREFSSPVKINFDRPESELAFLMSHDSDDFNRWDAAQMLTESLIWRLVDAYETNSELTAPIEWLNAFELIMDNKKLNPALKAEMLTLPNLNYLVELKTPANIDALYAARSFLKLTLAEHFKEKFFESYEANRTVGRYEYKPDLVSKRSLKNLCLQYLVIADMKESIGPGIELCRTQWETANNMTDALGVLHALMNWPGPERERILADFYDKWQHNALVLDKWFKIQALSELPNTLDRVKELMKHPSFEITNPNKVYSLIGAFTTGNLIRFHDKSGAGYTFLADVVLQLDALNPQVASRMVKAFTNWKRLDSERQDKIRMELNRLLAHKLSKDVFEIVSKCLAADTNE